MKLVFSELKILIHGKPVQEGVRTFNLPPEFNYTIWLKNLSSYLLDYRIFIDEKPIGVWRVHPFQEINLERPVDRSKMFFFTLSNSVKHTETLTIEEFLCDQPYDEIEPDGTVLKNYSSQRFSTALPVSRRRIAQFFILLTPDTAIELL